MSLLSCKSVSWCQMQGLWKESRSGSSLAWIPGAVLPPTPGMGTCVSSTMRSLDRDIPSWRLLFHSLKGYFVQGYRAGCVNVVFLNGVFAFSHKLTIIKLTRKEAGAIA